MKNIIYAIFFVLLATNINAQDSILKSKQGIPILPQAGDWAIGIDARPFTKIFNNTSDVKTDFVSGQTIIAKNFITANLARRIKLRVAFNSTDDKQYVIKDGQEIPEPSTTVSDKHVTNFTNITLGYGLEKRSGYGRLQAEYGAEILLGYEKRDESFKYGNAFSLSNPNPTSYDFGNNLPYSGERVTFYEQGLKITGMLRAFIGVEYFFAPKLSIGGEFGWGVAYSYEGDGKQEVQSMDFENSKVKNEIYKTGGQKTFTMDNDNFGGALFLMFHFK